MALTKVSRGLLSTSIVDNGNATAITIDSSENVGFGTSLPARLVDLKDSSNADGARLRLRSATGIDTIPTIGSVEFYSDDNSTNSSGIVGSIDVEGIGTWNGGSNNAAMTFNLIQGLAGTTSPIEAMRIDSSGNVGIGTADPKSSLEVKGTFGAPATSGSAAGFISRFSQSSGVGSLDFGFGDPYSWIQSRASNNYGIHFDLALQPNGGNVGIGTSSPTAKVTVSGIGVGAAIDWTNTTASTGRSYRWVSLNNGTGFAVEDLTAGSERMRIDSSGNLLVGCTSPLSFGSGTTEGVVIERNTVVASRANVAPLYLQRSSSDGQIANFYRDTASVGIIGVATGGIWIGAGQGAYANIRFTNDQVHPCTASGAANDNTIDLGKSNSRWDDIYATNGTIQTSDRNEKQDIEELSDAEQRVAVAAKGLLRKFRWKDSVAEKGDEARTHFGIIAQDLQAAFAAEGLDAGDYAMFISSTWTDEETNEEKTRMGVRYSELLAFIIAAI